MERLAKGLSVERGRMSYHVDETFCAKCMRFSRESAI